MIRVAIQGIHGSYSEEAVREMLGVSAELVECRDFDSTFAAVASNCADRAVVPLRSKIVGEIRAVAQLIRNSDLRIIDEFDLEIRHVLAGTATAVINDITAVRSHREALKQCSKFLAAHPRMTPWEASDTASSIKRVVSEDSRDNAAIGSERAALFYGARILLDAVANDKDNWTTFGLIGRQ